MRTKILEATQGLNFGKFLVGELDDSEIGRSSSVHHGRTTLEACGFADVSGWRWVLDLQTREGVFVEMSRFGVRKLDQHQVWVCPLFEPTLHRLGELGPVPVRELPDLLELSYDEAPFELFGYRRQGSGDLGEQPREVFPA